MPIRLASSSAVVVERLSRFVNNVFALPPALARSGVLPPFLADLAPRTHAVQFYDDEARLSETVGEFFAAGLRQGDRAVLVATSRRAPAFLAGIDPMALQPALAEGRLAIYDADEVLSRLMVDDMPDAARFDEILRELLPGDIAGGRPPRFRAYGEMVDVLWGRNQARAALALEELWCQACERYGIALLCSYQLDHFDGDADSERFLDICSSHSHVIPAGRVTRVHEPEHLREIAILQQQARRLPGEVNLRTKLEAELRDASRECSLLESALLAGAKREQEARMRADASDAFKEMFLGILGHDLRNPLNTVLTTARMMTMREELAPDSHKRLERIIASGVRMERMVEQLLDISRARLADGIPIEREEPREIVPLVAKVVEEARMRSPGRTIELEETPCSAPVDADRFEQVITNLLGNAILHGDADQPIRVTVSPRGSHVAITVHNWGPPIDAAMLPTLFDPFRRGGPRYQSLQGLGLSLYISDHIVRAHGGIVEVRSTMETGTAFEAIFPRA